MRKKNVIADIHVGRRDLDLDKEVAIGKALGAENRASLRNFARIRTGPADGVLPQLLRVSRR
jgi:hypothetical protein